MKNFDHIKLGGLQQCNRGAIFSTLAINLPRDRSVMVVEVGVFKGATLKGLVDFLSAEGFQWDAVGIDLYGGPWNFDFNEVRNLFSGYPAVEIMTSGSVWAFQNWRRGQIDFLHIDGCHSTACFVQDFVLAEPLIASGGIVVVHDADVHCQGDKFDIQPHCRMGVGVRAGLHCLGLLNDARPGWRLLYDIEGAPAGINHGRGSVILQKA